ncbi:hypothetical protein [Frankia sp. Cppng1_Ct_nod]|uniref:hypothetical protein n=1 Tax=Frankia sp. Cppng1_Ct_nod TaxID=2897162 RepID=UPI0013EF5F53|nr:hypothetical protein [Frankia sp. Cppng1_Ct_nod]
MAGTRVTGTEIAALAGLDGAVVEVVEREADGSWAVHVTTAGGFPLWVQFR